VLTDSLPRRFVGAAVRGRRDTEVMNEPSALERDFPADVINRSAEQESWRKEVHRPATHTHKWWAQRLGTVFRGLLVSALTPAGPEAAAAFGAPVRFDGPVVLDPFAGSGTTLVEALKLGCRVVGQDINPVATLVQRQAVADWDRAALDAAFKEVEGKVRAEIDELHVTSSGETVLYYFWVALATCPSCPGSASPVELFSSRIFAKHAYVRKHPAAQASCPVCRGVVAVDAVQDSTMSCPYCDETSPLKGAVAGAWFTCPGGHRHKVVQALAGHRPAHRLYAKMVLGADGKKRYEGIDDFDLALYSRSSALLAGHLADLVLPVGRLKSGYNTRQAMSWGFCEWADFFNDRQLYCLGLLGAAVRDLPASPEREALAALFSGTLEFNNVFCSFKGEGTGAVRHMFSHHVLKPERVPLEAHPWGTPASSGSFSTLYKSRILRAMDYKLAPHDIVGEERVAGLSAPLTVPIFQRSSEFLAERSAGAMITTGSSAVLDLPDASVDLVLTDPPFFDNVHYSELADFFHAWLAPLNPFAGYPTRASTTRALGEVQHTEAGEFGKAIEAVWRECARVMKPDAQLAFTFHQSKPSGWYELVKALKAAGLVVTAVQPIKAEMSTASPKAAAAAPSNLDAVVVCRRRPGLDRPTAAEAVRLLEACRRAGTQVGRSDVQSVIRGAVMASYTWPKAPALDLLASEAAEEAEAACSRMGLFAPKVTARS